MAERVFTQTFCVAGAIIEQDGNFLLVKEATPKITDQGKWYHPASWIGSDEDPVAAAIRTVRRETGYAFTPERLLGIYSLVREDQRAQIGLPPHALKLIFTGSISGEPAPIHPDISETAWFDPGHIMSAMGQTVLRGIDVVEMIEDYQAGKGAPLDIITHTVQR